MAAVVNVCSVQVLNNPATFLDPFEFEIEYECVERLQDDLQWRIIYVGSAENDRFDQTLEDVAVGPVQEGNFKFVFQADAPDPASIPTDDVVGVTAVMITCSYKQQEFIRIGYYVSNEYADEELRENPPERPIFEKLHRNILSNYPRVTRFTIDFDAPSGQAAALAAAGGDERGAGGQQTDGSGAADDPMGAATVGASVEASDDGGDVAMQVDEPSGAPGLTLLGQEGSALAAMQRSPLGAPRQQQHEMMVGGFF